MLYLPQKAVKVGAINVEGVVKHGQSGLDIPAIEPRSQFCGNIGCPMEILGQGLRCVGIGAAGQAMQHQRRSNKDDRVERHRDKRESISGGDHRRSPDHCSQGRCAARRVQAAGGRHGQDSDSHREGRAKCRIGGELHHRHTYQRRQGVASDDRPRLRGTGGDREDQDCGRSDRGHDQRHGRAHSSESRTKHPGRCNSNQCGEASKQPFSQGGTGKYGHETALGNGPKLRDHGRSAPIRENAASQDGDRSRRRRR